MNYSVVYSTLSGGIYVKLSYTVDFLRNIYINIDLQYLCFINILSVLSMMKKLEVSGNVIHIYVLWLECNISKYLILFYFILFWQDMFLEASGNISPESTAAARHLNCHFCWALTVYHSAGGSILLAKGIDSGFGKLNSIASIPNSIPAQPYHPLVLSPPQSSLSNSGS